MSPRDVVIFECAGRTFAIDRDAVERISEVLRLARPLNASRILIGSFVNDSGVVTVLSTKALLDIGEDEAPVIGLYDHLIVLKDRRHPIALAVDRVLEIASVDDTATDDLPPDHAFRGCAISAFEVKAYGSVMFLDVDRLLTERERERITRDVAAEDRRRQFLDAAE